MNNNCIKKQTLIKYCTPFLFLILYILLRIIILQNKQIILKYFYDPNNILKIFTSFIAIIFGVFLLHCYLNNKKNIEKFELTTMICCFLIFTILIYTPIIYIISLFCCDIIMPATVLATSLIVITGWYIQSEHKIILNKQKNSIDLIFNKYVFEWFYKYKDILEKLEKNKKIEIKKKERIELEIMLNTWEYLALAIEENIIDEPICYKDSHLLLFKLYKVTKNKSFNKKVGSPAIL